MVGGIGVSPSKAPPKKQVELRDRGL